MTKNQVPIRSTTLRILKRRWNEFPLTRRFLILLGVGALSIYIMSVLVYPEWKNDHKGIFTLIGLVIIAVVGISGDFINSLFIISQEQKLIQSTRRSLTQIAKDSSRLLSPRLRGIPNLIPREETGLIMDQLLLHHPVLLTGEAGTGKSGIAIALVSESKKFDYFPLLIDARRLIAIQGYADFRTYFDIQEKVIEAFERIGYTEGLMIIVDQLDNIAGTEGALVLINLLIECAQIEGVEVVVISRYKEANEMNAIRPLLEAGFREIKCGLIDEKIIEQILLSIGAENVNQNVLNLASNLLNLDLICETIKITGLRDISQIQDEISLWERYRVAIIERENEIGIRKGEEFLAEAIRLARQGLMSVDRAFMIEYPPSNAQKRLISSEIITQISGRQYQFSHEKLQDYLFAWDACEQLFLPGQVYEHVDQLHRRNIIVWMTEIYRQREAPLYGQFLENTLDG